MEFLHLMKLPTPNATVKAFYDIDTPITMAALRQHGRTDYIDAQQIPQLDIYFSFTGGPMLREIETRFGAYLPCRCIARSIRRSIAGFREREVCMRFELYGHVCSGSPAQARRAVMCSR